MNQIIQLKNACIGEVSIHFRHLLFITKI